MKRFGNLGKVSVCLATKNRPAMLVRCLQSIARQTARPFEVVLVDTSDTSCEKVIEPFKKLLNIKYIHHLNLNAPAARNMGLKFAAGDLLLFIDDDCVAERRWIEKMLGQALKFPEAVAISGRAVQIPKKNVDSMIIDTLRVFRKGIAGQDSSLYLTIYNCLLVKERLNKLKIKFDESLPREEDIDFACQILNKGGKIINGRGGVVYHWSRPTLWGFLKQRFKNSGNTIRLGRKWKGKKFYFYGSGRIAYLPVFAGIIGNFYHKRDFRGVLQFIGTVFLSVLAYEAGVFYYKFAKPENRQSEDFYIRAKYFFDKLFAVLLFIISLPLFLIISILIKIDSPGPVIFSQMRVGKDGKPFRFYKFRTMWVDAQERYPKLYRYRYSKRDIETMRFKLLPDPRVTRLGNYIRNTSVDELPNFINVIKGDMSLIGPRPEIPQMVKYYRQDQMAKFSVRPGITGYAQVNGRGLLTFQETILLDLRYVREQSLVCDLKILLATVIAVIRGIGAF